MIRLGRDHGGWLDRTLPCRLDPKSRDQACHDQDGLGHGELGADAHARAGSEGQIGEAAGRRSAGQEAAGIEGVRVLPQLAVPVQHPGSDQGKAAGTQARSAHGILVNGLPREDEGRWIEAKGLLHDGPRQDKVGQRLGRALARQVETGRQAGDLRATRSWTSGASASRVSDQKMVTAVVSWPATIIVAT